MSIPISRTVETINDPGRYVEPTVRLELTPAEAMVVSSALNLKRRMAIRSGVEPTERIDGIATRLRNALADVVQGMRV